MKDESKFSIAKRLNSFTYAFQGLKILIKEEHNTRIHVLAAICAIVLGCVLNISSLEWIAVCFAIGLVISTEILNSSIEGIADFISPEKHDQIKKIKDLGAAAVLINAITALVIGLVIFVPKVLQLC